MYTDRVKKQFWLHICVNLSKNSEILNNVLLNYGGNLERRCTLCWGFNSHMKRRHSSNRIEERLQDRPTQ